jgi:FAD/FMN-containing dehydrogenase
MGWLARQLGLACDNVLSYELVTADGELVRATESEHADLFWGLRGGGGNFGVVTEFEFRLHPVGTAALVVDLFYRPDTAAKAMRVWRDLLPEGSRKTTFTAWAGTAGNAGYLPPELHGQPLVSVGYVWVGDPALGGGQLDAVKAAVPPIAERAEELSYLALQQIEDEDQQHRIRRYWKGHYLRTLDDGAIDAFVSRGGSDSPGLPAGSLQSYGGAIADIAPDDTPFGHRDALVEFVGSSRWTDPADDAERIALGRRYGAAMEPYASGVYVNVLSDEGSAGVERAYGAAKMARLAALKDRYDPENVFHLNQNIRPTRVTS